MRCLLNTGIVIALVLGYTGEAQAKELYVDQSSPVPTAPYTNAMTAAHTIQAAIDAAEEGDAVILTSDTYTPSAPLVITNAIALRSWTLDLDRADNYVIDAQHAHKVLDLGTNACQVIGLTIKNGDGGGINCGDSTPLVWNCIITGNENGGGMYKGAADNCIFTNNHSYYGGGANLTEAEYCLFVDNSATYGAGIKGGTARSCTFINNIATEDGGGAYQSTLNQCALTANLAADAGGGTYYSTANNCTFTDNMSLNSGGGMYGGTANNSILWNNQVGLLDDNIAGGTQAHYSCYPEARTDDGLHNITNNPQLVSFSHIDRTSPCIGAGSTNYLTHITDIDGESWNPTPVIGCDEIKSTVGGEITPLLSAPERVVETEEIHFTAYVEGAVTQTILDFGDGTAVTNPINTKISHTFAYGNYWMVLTGYNDDYPAGVSVSNLVYSRTDTTTTIYVSEDGLDSFDGESWATAKKTIQAAVDAQEWAGGLVLVSNGTYSVTNEIIVNKDIRIQSLSGLETTTVQGDNHYQIFYLNNQHCRIEGFTIKNAGGYSVNGTSGGGAIYCAGSNPVVADSLITLNNSGGYGGGAMWRGTATNCTFSFNAGGNGPGAMQSGIAIDCLFENNQGNGGGTGGGAMDEGVATRCIFKNNTNVKNGGAMTGGKAYDCQFIGNSSDKSGGGSNGTKAYNCVFNGNKSKSNGGGMYGGTATHCTLTANQAAIGGGTYSTTLDHSIVWYNTASDSFDNMAYGSATDSCSPDLTHSTSGNITNNPQLVSSSHISPDSPCAGSGTIPRDTLDIDGENWRSTPAMGCDEPTLPYSADAVSISVEGPSDIPAGYKAFFTVDIQGAFYSDYLDFGDGQTAINTAIAPIYHIWTTPGTYDMGISAYDENNQYLETVTNAIIVRASDFNTIYVAPSGNDIADGRSWAAAKQTIQAAIDEQEFIGGQVIVSNGVYTLAETVKINKDIQFIGFGGATNTIIDAGSLPNYQISRGMEIGDNHSTVSGFTIRNANYSWTGGGIFCDYSLSPIVSNCIIENNQSGTAGGMYGGTAIDCVFTNNTASAGKGGGLYAGNAQHCQFIENYARDGGGGMTAGTAYSCSFEKNGSNGYGGGLRDGDANDCTFIENESYYSGAGMSGGTANDCTFIKNAAETPGGGMNGGVANRCAFIQNRSILNTGGGMNSGVANACYFTGNRANTDGGATSYTTLNNCTVTGNSANKTAGGCYYGPVNNSIVWNNTAGESDNDLFSANPKYTCSPDAPHGTDGCITNNPLLVSASHISASSPCIGVGDAAIAPETDIDGDEWNNPPAMGCDEIGATLSGPVEMDLIGPSPIRVNTAGDYIALFDGSVSKTIVDFGHGTPLTNAIGIINHRWPGPVAQNYDVVLTAFNDDYPLGTTYTQTVEVVDSASDLHVWKIGDDLADGLTWATAKQTIQAGIDAQPIYGGRVLVDYDIYNIGSTITIDKPVHLSGYNANGTGGSTVVVDAGSSNRCFDVGAVDCTIENFTLQNGATAPQGYTQNAGGGIRCKTTDPRIYNCTIQNCTAYFGGAVEKGSLVYCTLFNNVATQGGAAYQSNLDDCTVSSNSATYGGALSGCNFVSGCTLSNNYASSQGGGVYNTSLTNCTLVANTSENYGGGAYACTLDFCTITQNDARLGAGMYSSTADRSIFTSNNASVRGGGSDGGTAHNSVYEWNHTAGQGGGTYGTRLYNCTVVSNTADVGGGSYGNYAYNSIFWDNFAWTDTPNIQTVYLYNSCSPEADHGSHGNITNAPIFIAYAPGMFFRGSDYYLSYLSPCLNAGDNARVETERDFNGWDRILYGTVDMGACEMYFFAADNDGDGMQDGWELENFGGTTNAVADADADTDAFDNLGEFIAGTDPHDPLSYLKVFQTATESETPGVTMIHLEWSPSVEGRIYGVSWSTNLVDGFTDKGYTLPYPSDNIGFGNDLPKSFYKINVHLDN